MKKSIKMVSIMLVFILVFSCAVISADVSAVTGTNIIYEFKNNLAGYAEGTVTLESDTAGKYKLYWADDNAELSGYYPITDNPVTDDNYIDLAANSSGRFKFGYHTAIPPRATRVIAKNSSNAVVAEYSIPAEKRLASGTPLYKFNSYSNVHIDRNGFYLDANTHWEEALKFAVDTETSQPTEPTEQTDSTEPTEPTEPTESTQTTEITEPTTPTTPENPVSEDQHYILMYYQSGVHTWNDKDTFFNYSNSEYTYELTSTAAQNISVSMFDNKLSKYKCVAESHSMTYTADLTNSYTLTDMTSRGKSITIKEIAVGTKLRFAFKPDDNTLTIACV